MEEFESQVAKIQIGDAKDANAFVYAAAERAPTGSAELYIIAELPLMNPAAMESCEKICLAISSALKRAFKKQTGESAFETGIAQVNEELGKLAEMGQTHWIDKINCILACKEGAGFSIATAGKVSAYLLRGGEFTDISCSQAKAHPLKTFENVAFGKLKLDDVLILSTTQLFNYLSLDRMKSILENGNFLHAAQVIIEILRENAGPEVAFGTILNMQVMPGQTPNEEIDLENYVAETAPPEPIWAKAFHYLTGALSFNKKRAPKVSLPHISLAGSLRHVSSNTKNWTKKSAQFLKKAAGNIHLRRQNMSLQNIKGFSLQKKIFLASAVVLLLAVILEIGVSIHLKKTRVADAAETAKVKAVQNLLTSAQTSLLYKDDSAAADYVRQAVQQMPPASEIPKNVKPLYDQVASDLADMRQKAEKIIPVDAQNLGSLAQGDRLLNFGSALAVQVGSTVVSYDKTTGTVSDGQFLSSEKITALTYIKNTTAVVYNGKALLLWDFDKKQFSQPFISSVPAAEDFVGMKLYATNSRVYLINKKTNQIISFLIGTVISKPVVASKDANDLGSAKDLAIDGSIYVLNNNGVSRYLAGSLTDFHLPFLFTPLSGTGKIATEIGWSNIYILDAGNNRVLVIDKKGNLVETLTSKDFTKLKDFIVDEKNKVMYLLNDGSLLKISLP